MFDFQEKNITSKLYSAYQYAVLNNGHITFGCGGFFDFDSDKKIDSSTQFDLASITKAALTIPIFYNLFALKELKADEKISRFFGENGKEITLYELLSHTSGLPAWLPFYELIPAENSPEERKKATEKIIFHQKTLDKSKCYSDLNYLLLGFILEKIFSASLDTIFENFKKNNNLDQDITFFPKKETPKTAFSKMRGEFPEREVEDENSWFLGGITGHAGLFGSAFELVSYFDALLKTPWFAATAKKLNFAGFDHPEGENSNYGTSANPNSFGHLGFTGTAFLIDLEKNTLAALLTNSTHPFPDKPERKKLIKEARQKFFDTAFRNFC